jgi:hypothetical protein
MLTIVFVPVLWVAIPAAFCFGIPQLAIPFGVTANLLLVFSLIAANARFGDRIDWSVVRENTVDGQWVFAIAAAFALLTSVPIHLARSRDARNTRNPT